MGHVSSFCCSQGAKEACLPVRLKSICVLLHNKLHSYGVTVMSRLSVAYI